MSGRSFLSRGFGGLRTCFGKFSEVPEQKWKKTRFFAGDAHFARAANFFFSKITGHAKRHAQLLHFFVANSSEIN